MRSSLIKAIHEVLKKPTSAIPSTFKTPIKRDTPEESETLMRLEALESMMHRLSDDLPFYQQEPIAAQIDPAVGQFVFHKKFGRGKVLDVDSVGGDARAQVNFEQAGVKWLSWNVANMDILPS